MLPKNLNKFFGQPSIVLIRKGRKLGRGKGRMRGRKRRRMGRKDGEDGEWGGNFNSESGG